MSKAPRDHEGPKNVIELKNVSKIYRMKSEEVRALDDVSLNIEQDQMYAIMGPSGSGKSTMMNIIGCLDLPTRGTVLLDGNDIQKMSDDELAGIRGRKIGFVFQFFNLIPTLTAKENIELPMIFQGIDEDERNKRVDQVLGLVGLSDRGSHKPTELSGGQQQRVAIARALIMDAPIILADEPTGNLDSKTGKEIMDLFVDLHEEKKKTVILITHDQGIARYAHKTIKIKDGRIVKEE